MGSKGSSEIEGWSDDDRDDIFATTREVGHVVSRVRDNVILYHGVTHGIGNNMVS